MQLERQRVSMLVQSFHNVWPLHTAITHMITVLECWSLMCNAIRIHMVPHHSNSGITWVIVGCIVQSGV